MLSAKGEIAYNASGRIQCNFCANASASERPSNCIFCKRMRRIEEGTLPKAKKMTPQAEIALQFCRICLEWKDATYKSGHRAKIWPSSQYRCGDSLLDYTDLRKIKKLAEWYCWRNQFDLQINYLHRVGKWVVSVSGRSACKESLCQALMAACVETTK